MSNTQFAFIEKKNIPNREQLQSSIKKLGFNLELDIEYTPYKDEGYSPCVLNGEEVGFDIFYDSATSITEDNESLKQIADNKDYCISMSWGGSMKDCASAMIVSTALAKDFQAIISYEGDEAQKLEMLIDNSKSILKELSNKKIKKINIFNQFQKKAGTNLAEFLKPYGYKYNKKEKEFISYRNEIVFKISFDKVGYGSRIELLYWANIPLLGLTFDMSLDQGSYINGSITNFEWNIEEKSIEDVDKNLNKYIENVKELLENYIYPINSSKVNTYNLDTSIKEEYENRYSCSYVMDDYINSFFEQGKTQEDWTKEDSMTSEQLVEKEREEKFPFLPIRNDILKNIEKHKSDYESIIETHLSNDYNLLKVNEDIFPVELDSFLKDSDSGQKLVKLLNKYNYEYTDDIDYRGGSFKVANFQNTVVSQNKVKVILTENIFLEFEASNGQDENEIIAFYNASPFNFGWLIGSKNVLEKNIGNALLKLKNCLDSNYMRKYI